MHSYLLKNNRALCIVHCVLCILLFSSCDRKAIIDKNIAIPDYKWTIENKLLIEAEIKDTVHPHNIYINLRHAGGYQFSNLFLFMTTRTPRNEIARDTLELTLADERGRWYGDGMGDIWDNRILFKKNFRFPQAGVWQFELQQAMRVNPLPQVMDAGIRIEKSE